MPPTPNDPGDRLNSWKEIAVYLGREVRTVQRWEKCEGLPIRRHVHMKGCTIRAFKDDIDAWLDSRNHKTERAPEVESSKSAIVPLRPNLLAAARMPAKSELRLHDGAAGVGSLDLLQGDNRIRLYFYVQLRPESDANVSLKNLRARG